jgi:hypothetical protein
LTAAPLCHYKSAAIAAREFDARAAAVLARIVAGLPAGDDKPLREIALSYAVDHSTISRLK